MHVISRKQLAEFGKKYPQASRPLDQWHRAAKSARWQHLEEVKQQFPNAEAVGNFTIFNIKGNDYRLIASIDYKAQVIYIKYVLTHAQYDKDEWKNDPYY